MGITKDPAAIDDQEDDNEVSSCVEDELLGQVHLGPMPMKQYLELQMMLMVKRCPRRKPQAIVMIVGLAALVALAVWGTTALRRSANPAEQVAAEQAQLTDDLASALGSNYKAADYTAGDQKAAAQGAELRHDITGALGNNFKAAAYKKEERSRENQELKRQNIRNEASVDHNHPEQWSSHVERPHLLAPHSSVTMRPQLVAPRDAAQPTVSSEQAEFRHELTDTLGSNFGAEAAKFKNSDNKEAAEMAQLRHSLTGALGNTFKASDYEKEELSRQNQELMRQNIANAASIDHNHPEQWAHHMERAHLIDPHTSSVMQRPYVSRAAGAHPSVAQQAELGHELANSLGENYQGAAAAYQKEESSPAAQELKRIATATAETVDHNHPEQWLHRMEKPHLVVPHASVTMRPQLVVQPGAAGQHPAASPAPAQHDPSACDYKKSVTCSARSLFHSTEIHRVVTDNLMRTSSRLLSQADYEMVNEFAWLGFKKISAELASRAPDVLQDLEAVHLKQEQMHAVLDVMALLSDASVESLGYNIAKIIRASTFATKKYLKFNIEDSLQPIADIRKMANSLLPASVVAAWKGKGHDEWALTLDPENIRSMRMDTIRPNATALMDFKTKSLSVYAGVLQQGKVLLEIMRTYVAATGPSWSLGTNDAMAPLLNGITPPTVKAELDYMETFLWPLKCSSQGIDALRVSLCPRFDGASGGGGSKNNLGMPGLQDALESNVNHEIGSKVKKGAEGLEALRAQFKR